MWSNPIFDYEPVEKCGKSYGTELGCKYHVEGKCPKDLAIYVCRLCGFSAKEQGLLKI